MVQVLHVRGVGLQVLQVCLGGFLGQVAQRCVVLRRQLPVEDVQDPLHNRRISTGSQ